MKQAKWEDIRGLVDFHWKLNNQEDLQRLISTQVNSNNIYLREYARLEYLKLLFKHQRHKMANETISKILGNQNLPEGFKFLTFKTSYQLANLKNYFTNLKKMAL